MMRTILVPALAQPFAAHLQCFHLHLSVGEAALHTPHVDFSRGPAIAEVLASLQRDGDTPSANAIANYRQFCETHGVRIQDGPSARQGISASWVEETGDPAHRMYRRRLPSVP